MNMLHTIPVYRTGVEREYTDTLPTLDRHSTDTLPTVDRHLMKYSETILLKVHVMGLYGAVQEYGCGF